MKLILAPIRGITDLHYRNALARHFGGIDEALAPYIETKSNQHYTLKELLPSQNLIATEAQILSKDPVLFLELAQQIEAAGVTKINLNLGCPYPMVAGRGKGSGLLPHPQKVYSLLSQVLPSLKVPLSIKLRLGRENPKEIRELLPIFNEFKIEDICLHPRLGTQLYKGKIWEDEFEQLLPLFKTPPCYNGDITNPEDLMRLKKRFPSITRWMIGRGALNNPALFLQLKNQNLAPQDYRTKLHAFHQELSSAYWEKDHFIDKMKAHWFYLANCFEESHKVFKKIKKSKTKEEYLEATQWIFTRPLHTQENKELV